MPTDPPSGPASPSGVADDLLRPCLRDVIGLLSLSALWPGSEPAAILESVVDALLNVLVVDFAYGTVLMSAPDEPVEVAKGRGRPELARRAREAGAVLAAFREQATPAAVELPSWISDAPCRIEAVPLGIGAYAGWIVVGSRRAVFPDEREALLLRVAANLATSGIEQAILLIQRTRAEHAVQMAKDQLEQAVRARDELIAVVSHDLRTPLTAIVLEARTLAMSAGAGAAGDRVRKGSERIQRAGEQMSRLIDDLFEISRLETGRASLRLETHDPGALIADALDGLSPLAQEKHVNLRVARIPDLGLVRCDRDRVIRLLSNLLANAVKVVPEGSSVTLEASPGQDGVVFSVSDCGPGISPDELPRLFEKWWRGRAGTYRGTGMGLAIAKAIAEAHGGRIWAESVVGEGSTFYFACPARSTGGPEPMA